MKIYQYSRRERECDTQSQLQKRLKITEAVIIKRQKTLNNNSYKNGNNMLDVFKKIYIYIFLQLRALDKNGEA